MKPSGRKPTVQERFMEPIYEEIQLAHLAKLQARRLRLFELLRFEYFNQQKEISDLGLVLLDNEIYDVLQRPSQEPNTQMQIRKAFINDALNENNNRNEMNF